MAISFAGSGGVEPAATVPRRHGGVKAIDAALEFSQSCARRLTFHLIHLFSWQLHVG
jgi:hypothetical protein